MTLAGPLALAFTSSTLQADATLLAMGTGQGGPPLSDGLRIYRDEISQGERYPAIIMSLLSPGVPRKTSDNVTIWSAVVLQVKGVDEGTSIVNLLPMMNRVDELLESARGLTIGGQVYFMMAEEEISYPERTQGGKRYTHMGRRWRLFAR